MLVNRLSRSVRFFFSKPVIIFLMKSYTAKWKCCRRYMFNARQGFQNCSSWNNSPALSFSQDKKKWFSAEVFETFTILIEYINHLLNQPKFHMQWGKQNLPGVKQRPVWKILPSNLLSLFCSTVRKTQKYSRHNYLVNQEATYWISSPHI